MSAHAADNTLRMFQDYSPETHLPDALCEKLAKTHYENFTVGSMFLPRELRRHVYNVYAYCRVCDDLADETGDRDLSVRLLEWWRSELHECFEGNPRHVLFKALAETVTEFNLPIEPFEDLISAFLQDQSTTRYKSFEDILNYCTRSANPVGRIFLRLLGYTDDARRELADCTCTALQLANFWQDVGVDYEKGRIYIPLEDMLRFGYSESELRNHVVNASFVRLMRFEIARTRELFERGSALSGQISGIGAADVELFNRGGMAVLRSIERNRYDVFRKRTKVSKSQKVLLMLGWCVSRFYHRLARERSDI
ncbi:MAG: squalene synthase HpnC [Armatimonadota bacterium]|nr:squalene synthase HpnC [bacterium]